MKLIPFLLIAFGAIIIAVPKLLVYLIGGFFIFLGINGLIIGGIFSKMKKGGKEDYVKFGNYKIYR